jgi:hypothetical protein
VKIIAGESRNSSTHQISVSEDPPVAHQIAPPSIVKHALIEWRGEDRQHGVGHMCGACNVDIVAKKQEIFCKLNTGSEVRSRKAVLYACHDQRLHLIRMNAGCWKPTTAAFSGIRNCMLKRDSFSSS